MLFLAVVFNGDTVLKQGESDGACCSDDVLGIPAQKSVFSRAFDCRNVRWEASVILVLEETPEESCVSAIPLHVRDIFSKSAHAACAGLESVSNVIVPRYC